MNYKNHDRLGFGVAAATIILSRAFLVPAWVFGPIFLGTLVGTIWLSPDLDLNHSKPSQRWGILQPVWKKYAKKNKHRGISHFPIIGNISRIAYILTRFIGLPLVALVALIVNYPPILVHLILFISGVELYCLSHIISDHLSSIWKRIIKIFSSK